MSLSDGSDEAAAECAARALCPRETDFASVAASSLVPVAVGSQRPLVDMSGDEEDAEVRARAPSAVTSLRS